MNIASRYWTSLNQYHVTWVADGGCVCMYYHFLLSKYIVIVKAINVSILNTIYKLCPELYIVCITSTSFLSTLNVYVWCKCWNYALSIYHIE